MMGEDVGGGAVRVSFLVGQAKYVSAAMRASSKCSQYPFVTRTASYKVDTYGAKQTLRMQNILKKCVPLDWVSFKCHSDTSTNLMLHTFVRKVTYIMSTQMPKCLPIRGI